MAAMAGTGMSAAESVVLTEQDSINEAVATFVTANLKQGIDMVLSQMQSMNVTVDSANVVERVSQALREPYDAERHHSAVRYLSEVSQRSLAQREANFMAAAKARPGAQELDGGVVLETLQAGSGAAIEHGDTVVFHYRGLLPDGTVFDDTHGDEPLTAAVTNLVPGMTEGLLHMKVCGSYRLTIPSAKAYGSRGAGGGTIPPDTPLEFTMEIVEARK